MKVFEFDRNLFKEIEKSLRPFVDNVIDISNAPLVFSIHLDIEFAKMHGVTQKELSVKWVEKKICEFGVRDGVEVVTLVKDQVGTVPEILEVFFEQPNRIVLLT